MADDKKEKRIRVALWLLVSAAVVVIDQWTKFLCVSHIKGEAPVIVIPNVFRFVYVENRGAAFGILSGHRWIFMVFTVIAIAAMTVYLLKFSEKNAVLRCAMAMIIGGGIGNMIDRVSLEYVIDFIDFYAFPEIWSWVFNVADSFVCIGTGLLILYCILVLVAETKTAKKAASPEAQTVENTPDAAEPLPKQDETRGGES